LIPAQQPGFNEYFILLIGKRGAGKTTLCYAMGKELMSKNEVVIYMTPSKVNEILSSGTSIVDYVSKMRGDNSATIIFDDIIELFMNLKNPEVVIDEIYKLLEASAELEDKGSDRRIRVVLAVQKENIQDFLNYVDEKFRGKEVWVRVLGSVELDDILNTMLLRVKDAKTIDDAILAMHHTRRSVIVDLDLLWNKIRYDESMLRDNIKVLIDEMGIALQKKFDELLKLVKIYLRTHPMEIKTVKAKISTVKTLIEYLTGEAISRAVREFSSVNPEVYSKIHEKLREIEESIEKIIPTEFLLNAFNMYFQYKEEYDAIPVKDYMVSLSDEKGKTKRVKLDLALLKAGEVKLIIHVARPKYQKSGSTKRRYIYTKDRTRRIINLASNKQAGILIISEGKELINKLMSDIASAGLSRKSYTILDLNILDKEDMLWLTLADFIHESDEIKKLWIQGFENILKKLNIYDFILKYIGL